MPELPSGTVTFLFTDIEGSTQRWQQQPEAMGPALARHDRLLRDAIEAHGGAVFKTVGDAFCAAFVDPTAALAAALTAQRALFGEPWGQTGPLRVRMALHTGRAEAQGADYAGAPLNRVARLLAAGHGGQVLLSGATAELVQDHLPPEVHLRDLGTHQLKDLYRPERVFQLVTPDLPADFSPLRTADHLPPYPARAEAAEAAPGHPGPAPPAPAAPARPSRRRLFGALGGGLALAAFGAGGAIFAAGRGRHAPPPVPTAGASAGSLPSAPLGPTPTLDPFVESNGTWGTLFTPPAAPAFAVLGLLAYDAGWQGAAQALPGPVLLYVPPQPYTPPTVWFGGAVVLTRYAGEATPGPGGTVTAGTYVDLRVGDLATVPARTSFAVQTSQYEPAALVALILYPGGPPAAALDALYWEWWSWGTVESWPPAPVAVRFASFRLAPGASTPLPARAWPQLIDIDNYTGPALRLMLAGGGGEAMPAFDLLGKQPVDLDAGAAAPPGTAGTPGDGASPRGSRRPITPGVEAALGGKLRGEAAFLRPGTGGTLRNPSEARESVGVIVVSFDRAGAPA
jgi:class 3 adenylate cyclase